MQMTQIFYFLHHLVFKLAFSANCKDEKLNCFFTNNISNIVNYCTTDGNYLRIIKGTQTVHHKALYYIGQ